MAMTLADRCQFEFDSGVRQRGDQYFTSGLVRLLRRSAYQISCMVYGTSGDYLVQIDWGDNQDGDLYVSCECPHFDEGSNCKHLWAVIRQIDQLQPPVQLSGTEELTLSSAFHMFDEIPEELLWEEQEFDTPLAESARTQKSTMKKKPKQKPSKAKKNSPPPKPLTWQDKLTAFPTISAFQRSDGTIVQQHSRKNRAWLVINLDQSERTQHLTVDLFQQEQLKHGGWGKVKNLNVYYNLTSAISQKEDRTALSWLLMAHRDPNSRGTYTNYSYNSYSTLTPRPETFSELFPAMCAGGRCVWRKDSATEVTPDLPRLSYDSRRWKFRLLVDEDAENQCWRVRGELYVGSGKTRQSLNDPLLVLPGMIMSSSSLARMEGTGTYPWIPLLRKERELTIPFADREQFQEMLWNFGDVPEWQLPESLRFTEQELVPQGVLRIFKKPAQSSSWYYGSRAKSETSWAGEILFDYSGRRVKPEDLRTGILSEEPHQVIRRNHPLEEELIGKLLSLNGVSLPTGYSVAKNEDVSLTEKEISNIAAKLLHEGWLVEGEAGQFRKATDFQISVVSGIDWFELQGEADFQGQSISLPELLKGLRGNQTKFVKLADGSQGLIPEDWLARLNSLLQMGKIDQDSLKFRPAQALLLDALLAEQPSVSLDDTFRRIRKELQSFKGIKPKNPPKTFQGTLRDYQREGLGWLHFLQKLSLGGCLADDMGLGKTIQILALLEDRRIQLASSQETFKPSLIVVPKSLIFNWIEEAKRFTPQLSLLDYTGVGRKSLREEFPNHNLVITTYGTLRRDVLKLKDHEWDYIILDESQAMKNASSQIAKATRVLNAQHRLALTGTPVENHLGELWSLFEFLNPGLLGQNSAFEKLSKQVSADDPNLQVLAKGVSPYLLRRTKAQVLTELPEKTEQTLHCELSGKQKTQYEKLRDYYRALLIGQVDSVGMNNSKMQILEALLRLRQAACHPGLIDPKLIKQPSAKLETLLESLEEVLEGNHKALVFSQFPSFLAILKPLLDAKKIRYEYLDGSTTKRQEKVERFQNDPDCPLFLISIKAGGHGLNLTAADYVFILDPWWNPAVEAQAIDRAHRMGQTKPVLAYRIIAQGTIEERILELQQQKQQLAEAVISENRSLIQTLTRDDLEQLFR